jgi:hypothetical protein
MPLAWYGSSRTSVVDIAVGSRSQAMAQTADRAYMLGVLVADLRNTVLRTPQRLFFTLPQVGRKKRPQHTTNGTAECHRMVNYQTTRS